MNSITVVIPTHNRAAWLNEALLSVLQSPLVAPDRVIVVADACYDHTGTVALHHSVRLDSIARGRLPTSRRKFSKPPGPRQRSQTPMPL
jgi:glycosyltransferase involved in cell wall biosynthesis